MWNRSESTEQILQHNKRISFLTLIKRLNSLRPLVNKLMYTYLAVSKLPVYKHEKELKKTREEDKISLTCIAASKIHQVLARVGSTVAFVILK